MAVYQPTKISYLAGVGDVYAPIYSGQNLNLFVLDILKRSDKEYKERYELIQNLIQRYSNDLSMLDAIGNVFALNWGAVDEEIIKQIEEVKKDGVSVSAKEDPLYNWWQSTIIDCNYNLKGDSEVINNFVQFLYDNGGYFLYTCFTDEQLGSQKAIDKKNTQLELLLKIKPSFIPLELCKAIINLSAVEHLGLNVEQVLSEIKGGSAKIGGDELSPESPLKEPTAGTSINDWVKGAVDLSSEVRKWFQGGDSTTTTTNYYNASASSSDFSDYMPYILGGVALVVVMAMMSKKKKK